MNLRDVLSKTKTIERDSEHFGIIVRIGCDSNEDETQVLSLLMKETLRARWSPLDRFLNWLLRGGRARYEV